MRHTLTLPDFEIRSTAPLCNLSFLCTSSCTASRSEDEARIREAALGSSSRPEHSGQIFVSRTQPGVTRGNHFHHTKTEKFLVVEGDGLIRMRPIEGRPSTSMQ